MLDHNLVLKSDELYLAGDQLSDGSSEQAAGLYLRDTRFLNHLALKLNGTDLDRLSARTVGPSTALLTLSNGLLKLPDGTLLPHSIAVEQRIDLGSAMTVKVSIHNYSRLSLPAQLDLELAADFRDLFDIRGVKHVERGEIHEPSFDDHSNTLTMSYTGIDGNDTSTTVTFDQKAEVHHQGHSPQKKKRSAGPLPNFEHVARGAKAPPMCVATFKVDVAPGENWSVTATITPHPVGDIPVSDRVTVANDAPIRPAPIYSDNDAFDAFINRCDQDLEMLMTSFPQGTLPAAGIPWYVAPFGRDSLIVGLQTVHIFPERSEATLRVLASMQGTQIDTWRDEQPGKIIHEMRYGEMARTNQIPQSPYYGTVDATPLFVWLFAETVAWTGDQQLYRDLLPNAKRAMEWAEKYGDADGDSLVEYDTHTPDSVHISNKGWKDSSDSLNYRDGRRATGEIALVEVQGYVYASYARMADVADRMGDHDWSDELRRKAERVRRTVEETFWMEDEGFYAQALAGDKQHEKKQVDAISSNAGQLLFSGLPSPERAARVAERLAQPDMSSGWGIRTLSTKMPTYNPISYHNGSVWPHDNSLIVEGLRRYGHAAQVLDVVNAIYEASRTYPLQRLPELYCGFAREGARANAPVDYPVSCSPQAWAAGAGFLLLKSVLGLRLDADHSQVLVDPFFPTWLDSLTHVDLEAFGTTYSVAVQRRQDDYNVGTDGPVVREPFATPTPV